MAAASLPRIRWFSSSTPAETKISGDRLAPALTALGWRDGVNCQLEISFVDNGSENLRTQVTGLARSGAAVHVTYDFAIAKLLQEIAPQTPLVISSALDPVQKGFAKTLARPGGNVTGISMQADGIARKRLALLHEALPQVTRLGYVFSAGAAIDLDLAEFRGYAPAIGVEVQPVEIDSMDGLTPALERFGSASRSALFLFSTKLIHPNRKAIAEAATAHRLPTMGESNIVAKDGALMAYGADQSGTEQLIAGYIDKILRGALAGDLPFRQAENFALSLNARTAAALGINFSQTILAQAVNVFE